MASVVGEDLPSTTAVYMDGELTIEAALPTACQIHLLLCPAQLLRASRGNSLDPNLNLIAPDTPRLVPLTPLTYNVSECHGGEPRGVLRASPPESQPLPCYQFLPGNLDS